MTANPDIFANFGKNQYVTARTKAKIPPSIGNIDLPFSEKAIALIGPL